MDKKIIKFTLIFLILVIFTSCFDLYESEYIISEPYFVSNDPGAPYKTLYIRLEDGNALGRVMNVKKVGHTDKFIIAKVQNGYYFIDRKKDNQFLNSDEIIGKLRSKEYFQSWLDTMKIQNLKFDYE